MKNARAERANLLFLLTSKFVTFSSPLSLLKLPNDDGDGNENATSNYKFVSLMTMSTFLIEQGYGSSSKMALVETVLNLREKMRSYPQVLTFFIEPQIWLVHVVVLLTTAKKWTKVKNVRAARAKLLFFPTKHRRCRRRCRE